MNSLILSDEELKIIDYLFTQKYLSSFLTNEEYELFVKIMRHRGTWYGTETNRRWSPE